MKKKFLKFLSMILIAAMIVTGFTGLSGEQKISAAERVRVYVTIADDTGALVVRQQSVDVTDVDSDGKFTIYDTLYCAHEKYFKGGAEAGFAAGEVEGYEGKSLFKLWGIENGGSYGYCLNDKFAWSLMDEVTENNYLNAYVFTDTVAYSDTYSFFESHVYGLKKNKTLKIKLFYYTYDENFMPVAAPLTNARLIINGNDTEYITNSKGYVKVKFEESGSYFISAVHPVTNIVAPSTLVFVKPAKGDEITVKGLTYTVTKNGTFEGKKGKVTISKAAAGSKKIPKTIEYACIKYKVKVVD